MSDDSSLRALRKLPEGVARPLSGFASQVYGLDENGRPKFWTLRKGNVDELLSMPTIVPELLKLGTYANPTSGIPYVGAPMRKAREWLEEHGESLVPEVSRDAERRQRALKRAIRQEAALSAPQGLAENTLESLGTMAGQLPLPASKAKQGTGLIKRLLGAIPEYLGPTIVPKRGNYLTGTVAGGVLGSLNEDEPETEETKARGGYMNSTGMRPRGALRFGYGGAAQLVEQQRRQNAPYGLTNIQMSAPSSGTPTTSASPFLGSSSSTNAPAAPTRAAVMTAQPRTRAAPLNMDDYLNYGMRAAKKFYSADGGEVRRADEAIDRANRAISRLSARVQQQAPVKKADGGKAGLAANAIKAVQEAIGHLQNRDFRNARLVLQKSKEALAHPEVAKADEELRYIEGRNKGTRRLQALVEEKTPLGLAEGGPAAGAMPEGADDPQMLYVEMQQLVAAVQSGRLTHEEEEQASDRIDEIEQLLTGMGVQLPGIGDAGGGGGGMAPPMGADPSMMMGAMGQ